MSTHINLGARKMKLSRLATQCVLLTSLAATLACTHKNGAESDFEAAGNASAATEKNQIKPGVYSILSCNLSEADLKAYYGESLGTIKGDQQVSLVLKIAQDGTKTLSGSLKIPQYQTGFGEHATTHPSVLATIEPSRVSKISFKDEIGRSPLRANLSVSGSVAMQTNGVKSKASLSSLAIHGGNGSDEFRAILSNNSKNLDQVKPVLVGIDGKCDYLNMKLLKALSK